MLKNNDSNAYIQWFETINKEDVGKVGGKNANLGEMYQHLTKARSKLFPGEQVQVPYGFAVTAEAYREFIRANRLDANIKKILHKLNVNDIKKLAAAGQKIRDMILGASFPSELEAEIVKAYGELAKRLKLELSELDVAVRSSATAEDLPDASFAGQQETYLNIRGSGELLESIKKAFASLFTNRAISYRADKRYDHFDVALSVSVQKMARSDRGCAGVAFTLDTETGFKDLVLINGSYGLGELIVQGSVNPDEFRVFKPSLQRGFDGLISKRLGSKHKKLIYAPEGTEPVKATSVPLEDRNRFCLSDKHVLKLAKWCMIIEEHYGRPMDIEWAWDGVADRLYIVQARPETVQTRKDAHVLEEYSMLETGEVLCEGAAVGAKIGQGKAHVITDVSQIGDFKPGEVLVTEITDPDWEPIMKIASAIVTDSGGRTSHAAIISRELGVPAVVGCGNATERIKTGQKITVSCADGELGRVYNGVLKFKTSKTNLGQFKAPKTDVKLIAADPETAFRYASLPNKGVGLARVEFVISNFIKIHPNALLQYDKIKDKAIRQQIDELTRGYTDKRAYYLERFSQGVAQLAAAFYPYDVLLRFSDFKSNEYANLIGGQLFEPKEENPMLGWRGASRYYDPAFKDAFALEVAAVRRVREQMGLYNLSVMVPFCRTPEEGQKVLDLLKRYGLQRITPAERKKKKNGDLVKGVEVIVMAEIPSNVLLVDEFAKLFDGFSIGSNDLTQLTLGVDRDGERVSQIGNERNPAVQKLIKMLIKGAHKHGVKVGICGQGPSDFPDFAAMLVEEGIDSISINPDTVVKASLSIKQAEDGLAKKRVK